MHDSSFALFVLVVALAIGFGIVNGWNDAAIATVISTSVITRTPETDWVPRQ